MEHSDEDLRIAVDNVFTAYDRDNNGYLEENEIRCLISDALKHMGEATPVGTAEINKFIKAVDSNGDGKISKSELFDIFRQIISQ